LILFAPIYTLLSQEESPMSHDNSRKAPRLSIAEESPLQPPGVIAQHLHAVTIVIQEK
jgi:hypothetical protein